MIALYQTVPDSQIKKDGQDLIKRIGDFFKTNPKRKICNVQVWYGRTLRIKKTTIKEQIHEAVEEALKVKTKK